MRQLADKLKQMTKGDWIISILAGLSLGTLAALLEHSLKGW